MAGSLVLLHAAALFVRTVRNLETIDSGFDPTNLLVVGIEIGTTEYPDERIRHIRRELAKRLATQPGVNERLARRLWPKADALGRRVRVRGWFDNPTYEVVGVVPDLRVFFRGAPRRSCTTRSINSEPPTGQSWRASPQVRCRLSPPRSPGSCVRSIRSCQLQGWRALRLGMCGSTRAKGCMRCLAAASPPWRLCCRHSASAVCSCTAWRSARVRSACDWRSARVAATRLIASHLYGVTPFNAVSAGVSALLVVLVALPGCWLPARRAARVDPRVALRCE